MVEMAKHERWPFCVARHATWLIACLLITFGADAIAEVIGAGYWFTVLFAIATAALIGIHVGLERRRARLEVLNQIESEMGWR